MDDAAATVPTDDTVTDERVSAEELAAFNAGFSDGEAPAAPTEETPPVPGEADQPAPVVEGEPVPTPVAQTPEEWAKAQEVKALREQVEKVSGTAFGKIGGIERTLREIQERTPNGSALALTPDDFSEQFRNDFPDIVQMQIEAFNKAALRAGSGAPDLKAFDAKMAERMEAVKREQAMETMDAIREDWRGVVTSTEYDAWLKTQPAEYQEQIASSWKPAVVLKSIETFEASKKPKAAPPRTPAAPPQPAAPRRSRMATAVMPKGEAGAVPTAKTELDYFNEGWSTGAVRA